MRSFQPYALAAFICAAGLATAAESRACAEMMRLKVDPLTSTITATVDKPLSRMNGSVTGSFRIISGEVEGDPANPGAGAHVELIIDPTSYSSGLAHRDNAVLAKSLQTAIYSDIRFVGSRIDGLQIEAPGAMGSGVIDGNLTMHGETRELRVPFEATLQPDHQEFFADGTVKFDYTDWGVEPPRVMFMSASKEVAIDFHIVARPAAAPTPSP
jgi:polyisoprenoid-binding protein YceI